MQRKKEKTESQYDIDTALDRYSKKGWIRISEAAELLRVKSWAIARLVKRRGTEAKIVKGYRLVKWPDIKHDMAKPPIRKKAPDFQKREPWEGMDRIYQYTDYKKYLSDIVKYGKESMYRVSLEKLAQRANTSKGLLFKFISGDRIPNSTHLLHLAKALSLNKSETKYLVVLTEFNTAKDPLVKEYFKREFHQVKKLAPVK
jgi:hypothetical protein